MRETNRFASLAATLRGYKAGSRSCVQPTSSCTISHHLPLPSLHLKRKRDRENISKKRRELLGLQGVVSPSFGTMARFGLLASEVMQEHLQNLMSQGYMTAAELVTCRVLEDPASPIMVGGIYDSGGLHDPVRGLHGDWAPLQSVKLFILCLAIIELARRSSGFG
jgi:hypothetical protein